MFVMSAKSADALFKKVEIGVNEVKVLPYTSYVKFEKTNRDLRLTATDGTNYLTVKQDGVIGTPMTCVVKASSLLRLPSLTSREDIKFTLKEDHLEIKGNGTYKLSILPLSEFPVLDVKDLEPGKIKTSVSAPEVKRILDILSGSVSLTGIEPSLTGYMLDRTCITTTGIKLCAIMDTDFEGKMLISSKTATLLSKLVGRYEVTSYGEDNNTIKFESDICTLIFPQQAGLDEYPDVSGILGSSPENSVELNRAEFLILLERVMLFADKFDDYGIGITITKNMATIKDIKEKCIENIAVTSNSSNSDGGRFLVNAKQLKDIISKCTNDIVVIQYQSGMPIRIMENDVVMYLCTMSEV